MGSRERDGESRISQRENKQSDISESLSISELPPGAPRSYLGAAGEIHCDRPVLGVLPSCLMTAGSALVCEKPDGAQHLADTVLHFVGSRTKCHQCYMP